MSDRLVTIGDVTLTEAEWLTAARIYVYRKAYNKRPENKAKNNERQKVRAKEDRRLARLAREAGLG